VEIVAGMGINFDSHLQHWRRGVNKSEAFLVSRVDVFVHSHGHSDHNNLKDPMLGTHARN
jgi:hypothetical protein